MAHEIGQVVVVALFAGALIYVAFFRKDPFIERVKKAYGEDPADD